MFRERPQYIAVARCIQCGRQSRARRHFSVGEHRPRLTEQIVGSAIGVAALLRSCLTVFTDSAPARSESTTKLTPPPRIGKPLAVAGE